METDRQVILKKLAELGDLSDYLTPAEIKITDTMTDTELEEYLWFCIGMAYA